MPPALTQARSALPLLLGLCASLAGACADDIATSGAGYLPADGLPEPDGQDDNSEPNDLLPPLAPTSGSSDGGGPLEGDAGAADAGSSVDGGDATIAEPDAAIGTSEDASAPSCVDLGSLDVLFVVDNSKSMSEEQAKLAALLPRLASILASGDRDLDGVQDFAPVDSLHLGVVTTDMGGSGNPNTPSCEKNYGFGDDGILVTSSRATQPPCQGFSLTDTTYLSFVPGVGVEPEQVARDLGCLASVGVDGCGFEQPLEAMYKALAPDTVRFAQDTPGHGNLENAGFLREEATLVVIHVSDEDDCSITSEGMDLFVVNATSPAVMLPGTDQRIGLNLRCGYKADDPTLVHPVQRYIDGLKALKATKPNGIIFAAIAGVPLAAEALPLEQLLAHPDMVFAPDPNSATGGDPTDNATPARAACVQVEGDMVVTHAIPARRFVQTAMGFGTNGVVRSICGDSFESALVAIVERIAARDQICELL